MRDRFVGVLGEESDPEVLLTAVLGGAFVLALLVVVVFALFSIGTGDTYTEFYVLGPDGSAAGYPENVSIGESVTIHVGIGNFEGRQMTYTLVVRTNATTFERRTVTLDSGYTMEEPIRFAFDSSGSRRLQLELYRGDTMQGEPYRRLRLLVEVTPS